jgi:hypothetical protein
MVHRIERLLTKRRAPLWLGLTMIVVCLPCLRYGLQADDVLFPWKLERGGSPWSLFQMEPGALDHARAQGVMVWWSSPTLTAKFLRPLASASHALDFALFPDAPWLMRLLNVCLYGGAVALAALCYRRLSPSALIASVAALLFAVDDGHAQSTGWIAGRNTLLALFFALLALLLHIHARARGARWLGVASAASVGLALASAEAGVWALSFLISYALVLESGRLTARLRTIALPLAVGGAWAAAYVALGCGFRGSSFYRDPATPVDSLLQGMLDLPVWTVDLVGIGGYPFSLLYPARSVRLATLPIALLLLWLLLPSLRRSQSARFYALAALLSLVPLLHTLPTSRVLLGPSFGALGWVGCAIAEGWSAAGRRDRWSARFLFGAHVVIAALLFVPALGVTESFAYGTRVLSAASPPHRDVVLVRSPIELLSHYTMLTRTTAAAKATAPRTLHQLYTGASALWFERIDDKTLDIGAERGWGYVPIERIFCAPDDMPRAGSEVRLATFTARVLASNAAGMPERVRFVFPTALESDTRQWLIWEGARAVPWTPPRVGERLTVGPLPFAGALRM